MPELDGKEYEYTEEGIEQYEEDKERFNRWEMSPEELGGMLMGRAIDRSRERREKREKEHQDRTPMMLSIDSLKMLSGMGLEPSEMSRDQISITLDMIEKGIVDPDYRIGKQEGGELDAQMADIMPVEEEMVPDEQMEDDYTDFIIGESLTPEDEEYLLTALEQDDRLSMIFDQVVDTASEFSGSGSVEGPGTERSDSIPARLSDGEFVMTSKAADQIGPDNLQSMMEEAETVSDENERRIMQAGGYVEEKEKEQEIVRAIQSKEEAGRVMPKSLADKKVNESMIALNPRNSLFAS